jgi:hypothetical protein
MKDLKIEVAMACLGVIFGICGPIGIMVFIIMLCEKDRNKTWIEWGSKNRSLILGLALGWLLFFSIVILLKK